MFGRPKLEIPKTFIEKCANIIGYGVFLITLILMINEWRQLPGEVPVHFGASGEVNRYGSPLELLMLPVVAVILTVGMELLEKRPEIHNYPARLDDSNRAAFYLNSRKLLNLIKNACLVIFSLAIWEMLSAAVSGEGVLGIWLVPAMLALTILPILYSLIKRRRIT